MRKKILIVDDAEINRRILVKILNDTYDTAEASNGKAALDLLKADPDSFSAVILDLSMPVMDGFELLSAIRSDSALSSLPVIVATGSGDDKSEERALEMGANDYVTKPYNSAAIRHRLDNTVSLRESMATVHHLQRDRLTGLYNRETFIEHARRLIDSHEDGYYIISCINIDSFKLINDKFGTETGDRVLANLARTMTQYVSGCGGICCRVMADNFALLLPRSFAESADVHAFHNELTHQECINGIIIVRIGRYTITDKTLSVSAMYDRAALAETSIKGRFDEYIAYYDENMRKRLVDEQLIVSEMNIALQERQFEVWYQPQYNHALGTLIGAEALVRWRHPERGMIGPYMFISIFEQNGFIYELDKFVWEECCANLRRWIDEGKKPLPLSVNISRYDIFKPDIVTFIIGLIQKYRLTPEMLRLEITESAFAKSMSQIIGVVKQLMDFGFTIEIDDFGSGYSSLNTLKDVPANVLKLDMRFLEGSGDSQRGGNIIESVVRMTKWLGMAVIAEGVETKSQADYLKSIGCNYVQGYLYAKPMTVSDYEALACNSQKENKLRSLKTVDNLDNNTFWNPESMDTLIFNSYIGGACIFEYSGGNVELLRANDKYTSVFGSANLQIEDALRIRWEEHLDSENISKLQNTVETSIRTGEECKEEFVFNNLPGCPPKTYLRSTLRVIAVSGESALVYCTNDNITAQRQAEQNGRRLSEQLKIIMDDINCGVTASVLIDGNISFLFTNDRYFSILGYTREQYNNEVTNLFSIILPEDESFLKSVSRECFKTQNNISAEYRVMKRDGSTIWVRSQLSMTKLSGVDSPVQLCIMTDITTEKEAEHEIQSTDEQLRFLNDTAHDVLAENDSERGIDVVLGKLLNYFKGKRAYIFEYGADCINNTYELCAPGVIPYKDILQNVPFDMCEYWVKAFENGRYIDIPDVAALDDSRGEKEILIKQGVSALIAVPLCRDGKVIGCIGVDDPSHHKTRVSRLMALGDYIAIMLTRRDLNRSLQNERDNMMLITSDIPGGFCRLKIDRYMHASIVFVNDGFCRLIAMSREEIMRCYGNDTSLAQHPDDRDAILAAYKEMFEGDGHFSVKYRIRHGERGYIWIMVFGRLENTGGEYFFNAYYTDITGELVKQAQQKELLDNIPCGASLFKFDGEHIKVIHMNRRYMEMVNRSFTDFDSVNVDEGIHPDDLAVMYTELHKAVSMNKNAECVLRILNKQGSYEPFHVTGRSVDNNDGTYSIYVVYEPISDSEMNFTRTLPFLLNAIMQSSTDLSFAKDINLRYLCTSAAFARMVGCEQSSIIGHTDEELFDRELADKYRADDLKVIQTGESLTDMVELITPSDGMPHYSRTSKYALRDTAGKIIGLYGTGRDITENRETYAQLKLLTDSVPGGLASYVYCDNRVRLTYFNDGMCALFGYTREKYKAVAENNVFAGVFEEDLPELLKQVETLLSTSTSVNYAYRIHVNNDGYRWIRLKAKVTDRINDTIVINTAIIDVTEEHEFNELIRTREEEYRLAMQHSGNIIARYIIESRTVVMTEDVAAIFGSPTVMTNIPEEAVKSGLITPETAEAYTGFYNQIINGKRNGSAIFCDKTASGWRWHEAQFSTIFTSNGEPVSAVISFYDITEKLEKEAVYRKWQQSLDRKEENSYTLLRCNISNNTIQRTVEGTLLNIKTPAGKEPNYTDIIRAYADMYVAAEDHEKFLQSLSADTLLAGYYRGKPTLMLEYREKTEDGGVKWLRLNVDMLEFSGSVSVEAYFMFENIDDSKRAELLAIERAETDPLTGLLNRNVFSNSLENIIKNSKPGAIHALMMIDIDCFKLINDSFGHAAGDQALIEIANSMRSNLRRGDLICRLGGDEFVVFLNDIPNDTIAANKARQMCALIRKSFSSDVQISASIGISIVPRDGNDFATLYRKADIALYHVKNTGKDSCAFFHNDLDDKCNTDSEPKSADDVRNELANISKPQIKKRRMLIVDDSSIDFAIMYNIFKEDFIVEKARDGSSALVRLRHYGTAISVVLLDLFMPVIDGFAVLDKIQKSADLRSIPVIAVSGDENRDTIIRAIRMGASDFVTKPVDAELLRLRVLSTLNKAENERLRAQNSYLTMKNTEVEKYRTALECSGTIIVENDWLAGTFEYDPNISHYIAGKFDDRNIWHILLSDMVADVMEVKKLQEMVHELAKDRRAVTDNMTITLKTPSKEKHNFIVNIYKQVNDLGLASKFIITFNDTGAVIQG